LGQVTDKPWVELRALVQAAFDDKDVVAHPPRDSDEWGFLADTVADHLYAFVKQARSS
jgi:hypothetical protein